MKQEKAITEWRAVFLMGATVHFIGIIIYGIFASGELQEWAEPPPAYDVPAKPSLDHETTFVSSANQDSGYAYKLDSWTFTILLRATFYHLCEARKQFYFGLPLLKSWKY